MYSAGASRRHYDFAAAAAIALFVVCTIFSQTASADIIPTPTSTSGTTDKSVGGHGDLTVGSTFVYQDPMGNPEPNEDLRKIVVDTPAGGVGNPNAIPYGERCPKTQFESSTCPASSQIGSVKLSVTATAGASQIPLDLTGTVSIIQQSPEVPTLVGAYIVPPGGAGDPIRAYATFYPVTSGADGDFRIRSVTDDFPRTASTILGTLPIQVNSYEQTLLGKLANGNAFITNPTRCDPWLAYGYAEAWDNNKNADSDPLNTGTNNFKRTDAVVTTPDCSHLAPFETKATAAISSGTRAASPTFTTTVEIPGIGRNDQGPAIPKSIVATLPKALNVDVLQLGRLCKNEQFAVDACPANTQVGTVSVTTPMIVDGLTGKAYLTQASPGGTLPDLGIQIHGAINFSMRGINHYVNVSQLQSTFDNIPQVGFSKFSLSINGGANGLLKTLACPTGNRAPTDFGPVKFDMTSYQGQTLSMSSPVNFAGCYKVTVRELKRCVRTNFKLSTTYLSRSLIDRVKVWIRHMGATTITHSPFRVNFALGKHVRKGATGKYTMRVFYKPSQAEPKGTVIKKTGGFKRCK